MSFGYFLFAMLLTSASEQSEVYKVLKGFKITEKQLSPQEIRDIAFSISMKTKILKDQGVREKPFKLTETGRDVLTIVISFTGAKGLKNLSKTCKYFYDVAVHVYQTLDQIPLAVRSRDYNLKQLSYVPFRLMNCDFIANPSADPCLIYKVQNNREKGSFCAFHSRELEALDIQTKNCAFSDIHRFPKIANRAKAPKLIHCIVAQPHQTNKQFFASFDGTSRFEFVAHVAGHALLLHSYQCLPDYNSSHQPIVQDQYYHYIIEGFGGSFFSRESVRKHFFINENVIAFFKHFQGFQAKVVLYTFFDGSLRVLYTGFRMSGLTPPVVSSDFPGHALISWDNGSQLVDRTNNWKIEN